MSGYEIVLSVLSISLLMLLLVSVIIIVFFQSGRQRLKQQIELEQNKLNHEKELRQVETEVSEQVLNHIGRELHDNVKSLLTHLNIQIESKVYDNPELRESFEPTLTGISELITQVQMLSRTLNNDFIGGLGLIDALDFEIKRVNNLHRFTVHWQVVSGTSNLDNKQELMIFRIFQEIIQNALKHSRAKNIHVTLNNESGHFELKTEDDGKGFDYDSMILSKKASGLRNIIKRAKMAGIDCTIKSLPGKGCTYMLKKDSSVLAGNLN